MRAYVGVHAMTGKFYAWTEIPPVTQWGQTAEEAWANLDQYLRQHHNLAPGPLHEIPAPQDGTP